jgi:DNA primase
MRQSGRETSDQVVRTVRDRSDIVSIIGSYLALKKAGQNHLGLCPFHAEKTPSFSVSPSKQVFHCFGCGAGGDVFQFLMQIEGVSFPEALKRLAERAGVPLPVRASTARSTDAEEEREILIAINRAAAAYFHRNLKERQEAEHARRYLQERGIREETVEAFGLGYALPAWDGLVRALGEKFSSRLLEKAGLIIQGERPGYYDRFRGRLIFPIANLQGETIAFGGRALSEQDQPKYLNSPETPLYSKG